MCPDRDSVEDSIVEMTKDVESDILKIKESDSLDKQEDGYESEKDVFHSTDPETGAEIDSDVRVEPKNSVAETSQHTGIVPDTCVESDLGEKSGLTAEEKEQLKTETGWSDEIVDAISSIEEAQIYKDAGLVEAEINGKPCLINLNIDMDTQTDAFGRTNRQRMSEGLAPLDESGKPIELHHIGQHPDSPLAELTQEQHRGKDNYSVLHDTKKESEIDRPAFDSERVDHWKTRAEGENA
jgi:hypothetical protein